MQPVQDKSTETLNEAHRKRLLNALAQGGMPQLFWPGVVRIVERICTEIAESVRRKDRAP